MSQQSNITEAVKLIETLARVCAGQKWASGYLTGELDAAKREQIRVQTLAEVAKLAQAQEVRHERS